MKISNCFIIIISIISIIKNIDYIDRYNGYDGVFDCLGNGTNTDEKEYLMTLRLVSRIDKEQNGNVAILNIIMKLVKNIKKDV